MENQYPLNFDGLSKGQMLTIGELETVFGVRCDGSDRWGFLLLGLQASIHARTSLTCVITRDEIRILTDAEASENNAREVGRHCRGIVRRNEKLLQVDRSMLSQDQSREHDKRILVSGTFAASIIGARREIRSLPTESLPKRLEAL